MKTRLVIPLLGAGALAFACGPRSRSDAATPSSAATRATTKKADPKLSSTFGVQVENRVVHLALNVTNVGNRKVELSFPSGRSHDFVVVDSVGREVWHWADGRMFTQALQNKTLAMGESLTIGENWSESVRPGKYTAIAMLNSSNFPVEQRVDFILR